MRIAASIFRPRIEGSSLGEGEVNENLVRKRRSRGIKKCQVQGQGCRIDALGQFAGESRR